MSDVSFTLQMWVVRLTVYEQPNRLKFSVLALGLLYYTSVRIIFSKKLLLRRGDYQ